MQDGLVSFRVGVRLSRPTARVMTSHSTLRFRTRDEVVESLARATTSSWKTAADAPDRPGLEFVFIARRPV